MPIRGVGEGTRQDRKSLDLPLTLSKVRGRKQNCAGRSLDCSEASRTSGAGESSIKVRSLVSYRNTPAFQYCYAQSQSGKSPWEGGFGANMLVDPEGNSWSKIRQFFSPYQEIWEHVFTATMIRIQRSVEIPRVFLLSVRLFLPDLYFVLPYFSKLAPSALPCHAQTRKHRSDPRLP